MKRSLRTRAGVRKPRSVLAVVLVAALGSAFALSAGAASRPRVTQALGTGVTRVVSSPLRPPRLVVRQRSSGVAPGYIFIAPKLGQTAQGPEIVDGQGRPVWFHPGGEATDFRVHGYLGKLVLTWYQGGVDYIVDSSYHVIATVHAGNGLDLDGHEFALTPQGTHSSRSSTRFHSIFPRSGARRTASSSTASCRTSTSQRDACSSNGTASTTCHSTRAIYR